MKILETGFPGLVIIKPSVFHDSRGYFFESYSEKELSRLGIHFHPVQDNESKSSKGVIRGLHYQLNPHAQAKLIRVVEGKIYDVVLDLRRDSVTYGKCFGTELNSETKDQLFIPAGFAHGFSVLSDIAVILYKCDKFYNAQFERGISLRDADLKIDWKLGETAPVISDKDMKHPDFRNAEANF